jgi:two-component system, chemotaxis family, chemotaxis protein CheY
VARIMVVDDSAFIRAKYSKALIGGGFDVVEARNGAEALEKYREYEPDGVLLDVNMPVMDGIITLHELMRLDQTARVALVTCAGNQSIVLGALRCGASDCLNKPLDDSRIVTIANRLAQSRSMSEMGEPCGCC